MKKRFLFIVTPFLIAAFAVLSVLFVEQKTTEIKPSINLEESQLPEKQTDLEYQSENSGNKFMEKDKDLTLLDKREKEFIIEENKNVPLKKKGRAELTSQRKMFIKDENRQGRPDLFREWEVGIRTKDGEKKPGYSYNYKMKELIKSKGTIKSLGKGAHTQQLNFVERGPGNVSGRTRGIIVDPDDPTLDTWFAGSVSGGIWKTTNAGQTWTDLTPDLPNLATSTLAMAASNHNIVYAGTGEGFFNVDQVDGSGIWKSTDKGVTWNPLASTTSNPDFENVTRIIVDPDDENIVLASAGPGFNYQSFTSLAPSSKIFRSTDGGTSWDVVFDAGLNSIEQIVTNPLNFNTQYATINSTGVIKSVDGGLTWDDMSNGIGPVLRMELAIAPSDTSTLYFSAEGGPSGSILYASDDGGENWFAMSDTTGNDLDWLIGQGWYDNTIAVDPYDKNKIYVGGVDIFRMDRVAGTDTSDETVTGVDFENTQSFFGLVNWGGPYAGGGIGTGDDFLGSFGVEDSDYTSVEIRFGPGLSQMAHRFIIDTTGNFPYQDYVEVPFEVWDITNNRQLAFSFRDWANNGVFDLIPFDPNVPPREYMFINAIEYTDTASPDIAQTNGFLVKNIFGIWPILAAGGTWDPNNLPSSIIRINWGTFITYRLAANPITDGRGRFGLPLDNDSVHVDHHNILLIPTDIEAQSFRLVNGNDGGVSYSDDKGTTFLQPTNGYNTTQFYGVDKMNGGDRYIGGTQDNGSFISPLDPDNMSAWGSVPSGDGFEAVWHYNNPNLILESSQFNFVLKSTDGGVTWNNAGTASGLDDNGPFFTKLAKSKQDPDLVFALAGSGVWRSDDFADSWTLTTMPTGFNGTSSFSQVKISLVNPQIVWAGQGMSTGSSLFVSTDGGLSFNTANNYTDVALGRISSLETDPVDDSTAYALFSFAKTTKILKTTDLGQSWNDISGFGTDTVSATGFPDVAVLSLLVNPIHTDTIWAGTELGIYQTTDGGGSWSYLNEGLPAVTVYEMVVVNDEVVIATHGRGIWTVSLPELAGYEPPTPAALSPRLEPIAQNPKGLLVIPFSLRSAYDSSHVLINDERFITLGANSTPVDTTIFYTVTQTKTDSVQIVGYKNGIEYKSYMRTNDNKLLGEPVSVYANDFNTETEDFDGNGFTISQQEGFGSDAIHSDHPYSNSSNNIFQLLIPIIVGQNGSSISYADVAIIEPGEPGSEFGDSDFYDFVVVEGTKDGTTWIPLADGYDSRKDTTWLAAYDDGGDGDSTMLRLQSINILDTFSPGDTILIRFRLFADPLANAYGWVIDDLVISETVGGTAQKPEIPTTYSLSQNYPNPFNPTTIIKYQLPQQEKVTLEIFNTLGEKVKTLVNDFKNPGYYEVTWNGTNNNNSVVATGVYIYRLSAGNFAVSKKMIFLK